jgi:ABC-type glycerol-3-phosphate transport system substrate-binding protein
MKKKIVAIVIVLLLLTTVLAFSQKTFAGKSIRLLYFAATYAEAAKEYSKEFEDKTGCRVEVLEFPYLTLYEKMGLALSTGDSSYDVVTPACQWDGEFEPFMEDLTPMIKRDKFDSADIIPGLWEQSGKWAGKTMGIPFSNTPMCLAYRTDLVKTMPKTWDEFFKVCDKLNNPSKGFYAIAVPGVKEQFDGLWMMVHWSMGGRWADENWNVTIDQPETRKSLEIAKRWMKYADPAAPAWNLPECDSAFLNGNAAFAFSWPTLMIAPNGDNPEKSKVVGKWAIGLIPFEKNGATMLSSWDIGIPKAAKNKDAAWEWIKFYTSKEKQLSNFLKYSILPSRISVWNRPEVKKNKLYPHYLASQQGAVIWWRIPAGTMAETYVRDAVGNYITDQWDMDKTIKYMEDGFKKLLSEFPPAKGVKNTGR